MRGIMRKILLILGLLVTVSCTVRPPVTTDYDLKYDFSAIKTYAWLEPGDDKLVKTLDNKRARNAIETILNRKGYTKVPVAEADILLKTHIITDRKTTVDTFYRTWGYHPGPYFWGWPQDASTVVREYKIGTLVLDIVDPRARQVIWRGTLARKLSIYQNLTPEERATRALLDAEHLLASFPPQQ